MNLSNLSIVVTSFLRPGTLALCLNGLRHTLPECEILLVDDSYGLADYSHWPFLRFMELPFDSGLPAKRNLAVQNCRTPFLLMASDDFNFQTPEVRPGIERMLQTLYKNPEVSIAAGRVNNTPYEGYLEYIPGSHIRETPITREQYETGQPVKCDLTLNYFIARTKDIADIKWDERFKIGGEHAEWFLALRDAGRSVMWVPGVNIMTLRVPHKPPYEDVNYWRYRARARESHQDMMRLKGLQHYYGFYGEIK